LSGDFDIVTGSDKKNPVSRLFHMWLLVLQNRNAKYLLIDTYSSKAFWYAITASRLAQFMGLAYIPVLHGGELPKRITKSPKVLLHFLKNAAQVVCPSGFLKSEMDGFYSRDYKIIPNFIDLNNYPLCHKCLTSGVNILWVRSFHQIYNPLLAIDILHLLSEKGVDARLAMVGPDKDGSLIKTKQYAREKGILHKVCFTGGLSKVKWIEFSKDYNVFINTTNVDNTPVSVMEAMALGFPVISTNVGGVPFLIQSGVTGILVNKGDAESFADQIIRLSSDPDRYKKISQNSRKKAESWDWVQVRKKWLALLEKNTK